MRRQQQTVYTGKRSCHGLAQFFSPIPRRTEKTIVATPPTRLVLWLLRIRPINQPLSAIARDPSPHASEECTGAPLSCRTLYRDRHRPSDSSEVSTALRR